MDDLLAWLFAALAVALVVYGLTLAAAIASGVWFGGVWGPGAPRFRMRMLMRNEMPFGAADRQVEKSGMSQKARPNREDGAATMADQSK